MKEKEEIEYNEEIDAEVRAALQKEEVDLTLIPEVI